MGNQDCNRTKGMSFIAMEPHFGCNPDCFDYERNTMAISNTKKRLFQVFLYERKAVSACEKGLFTWSWILLNGDLLVDRRPSAAASFY